ncbi:hypothetical protein D5S17_09380 [Pseudonocardiaceae bacterium YIM PH 21723]|nr:hypothetical protein D5S17_09380 [Pseudonocardiaceae bacterium YIM PH 21723]
MTDTAMPATEAEPTIAEPVTEELSQAARERIAAANAEAAKYRIKARDAATTAKAAAEQEFGDQIHALTEQNTGLSTQLAQLQAALAAGVPADLVSELAPLLRGENPEELAEHAARLAQRFNLTAPAGPARERAVDPSQGHGDTRTSADSFFVNYAFDL